MPLTVDPSKSAAIDQAFRHFLANCDYPPGQVLLDYTLMMHAAWRPLLPLLPLSPGMRMLDVGTGYGLLADEIAANLSTSLLGIDIDPRYVEGARSIHATLEAASLMAPGSSVTFEEGDICSLPCDDESFDFVMVREVHQFVADPQKATDEVFRVTRPQGFACVSDNDDGLYLTYPGPSDALAELWSAVQAEQSSYGGDRQVGRKLSTFMSRSGFEVLAVSVIPEARHFQATSDDPERKFLIEQAREAKERLLRAGAISESRLDELIEAIEAEPPTERFRFNARVVVMGRRPEGTGRSGQG